MSEWTETALGNLCKFQAGDVFPKDQQGVEVGEYPFIKVSDMNLPGNERFIQNSNNWIKKADASNYRLHPPGSVVFAKIGEALRANRRRVLVRPTIIDNNMMSAVPKGGIDPSFLLYVLEGIDFNDISRGSALPYLAAGDLNKLTVTIPGKEAQQAIAATLSLLDQKIEVNRRMNETLEGMAQAIFRDWFVDFGPARRKAAGAIDPVAIMGSLTPDPARAAHFAALFPAALGNDGLPVGWRFAPLSDVLVLQRGFDLPKTTRTDGSFPVIAASGPSGTHNAFKVKGPGVCTGRSGVLGGVYYVEGDFWPLNTSLWVKDYPGSTPIFAFHLLRGIDLAGFNAGSAVPTLNRNHIHGLPTVKPPMPIIEAFDDNVGAFYAKKAAAISENETLAETLDYVLPLLMSGKARVGHTKRIAS